MLPLLIMISLFHFLFLQRQAHVQAVQVLTTSSMTASPEGSASGATTSPDSGSSRRKIEIQHKKQHSTAHNLLTRTRDEQAETSSAYAVDEGEAEAEGRHGVAGGDVVPDVHVGSASSFIYTGATHPHTHLDMATTPSVSGRGGGQRTSSSSFASTKVETQKDKEREAEGASSASGSRTATKLLSLSTSSAGASSTQHVHLQQLLASATRNTKHQQASAETHKEEEGDRKTVARKHGEREELQNKKEKAIKTGGTSRTSSSADEDESDDEQKRAAGKNGKKGNGGTGGGGKKTSTSDQECDMSWPIIVVIAVLSVCLLGACFIIWRTRRRNLARRGEIDEE